MAETGISGDRNDTAEDRRGSAPDESPPSGNAAPPPPRAADDPPAFAETEHLDSDPPHPEDDGTLNRFAESIMLGLEQAGLDVSGPKPKDGKPSPPPEGARVPEEELPYETFFAGWGGIEPLAEPQPATRPAPGAATDLARARAALPKALGPEVELDTASKHDALAEAVQSALLSVYGDGSSQTERPREVRGDSLAREEEQDEATIFDDGLSPQDVILNYFDYKPEGVPRLESAPGGDVADMRRTGADSRFGPFDDYDSAELALRSGYRPGRDGGPARDAMTTRSNRLGGPPAFPVPAAAPLLRPRPSLDAGRVLGAAGVGLIGGIGIAAALAIFLLNSYDRPSSPPPLGEQAESGTTAQQAETPSRSHPENEIVAADATGTAGEPVPLAVSVKSAGPAERTLVSLTGIPEGARLNVGVNAGKGNWLLPPKRLQGLTLSLPPGAPQTVQLEAQLLDSNLRMPLSGKTSFAVHVIANSAATGGEEAGAAAPVPAHPATGPETAANLGASQEAGPVAPFKTQTVSAAEAPQVPAAGQPAAGNKTFAARTVPSHTEPGADSGPAERQAALEPGVSPPPSIDSTPEADAEDLIREGNRHMLDGDIKGAREIYAQAIKLGDAKAALAMGRSYDPIYFARIATANAKPDAASAFDWYKRALNGDEMETAKVRIENLQHFLNQ